MPSSLSSSFHCHFTVISLSFHCHFIVISIIFSSQQIGKTCLLQFFQTALLFYDKQMFQKPTPNIISGSQFVTAWDFWKELHSMWKVSLYSKILTYIKLIWNRPWWPSGLMYDLTALKCCMVCIRSQVQILLGTTISIAQSQKWLVTIQIVGRQVQ